MVDRVAVLEVCLDGRHAFERYRALRLEHPTRELYFIHTSREHFVLPEQHWAGVRLDAASANS
ncbi:MAG: hypothetical protein HY791_08480 [Deltaproteobacteria bacterium]|nr:hypothetical protein [Deltaproteobacteria bacterium]